jgi:hypothetical protein
MNPHKASTQTRTSLFTRPRAMAATTALAMAMTLGLSACGSDDDDSQADQAMTTVDLTNASPTGGSAAEAALHDAMRALWHQHMEWTYATVAAFAADSKGLKPTLTRLLENQDNIGTAIEPYYGKEAGEALTKLLKTHINEAVPVLVAAQAGKSEDLKRASTAWYTNAKEIADFLAKANPNWPQADLEKMMATHIEQTLAYAAAQLQGKYADSITTYDLAEAHMVEMADALTKGIVAQFPDKFTG